MQGAKLVWHSVDRRTAILGVRITGSNRQRNETTLSNLNDGSKCTMTQTCIALTYEENNVYIVNVLVESFHLLIFSFR